MTTYRPSLDEQPLMALFEDAGAQRQNGVTSKDQVAAVQRWRTVIDTQMHFNRMLMRTRAAGVSLVIAVFGAAAVGLAQFPGQVIALFGGYIHITAVVIVFGLALLGTLFVLDYLYFYRMLLAVVRYGEEIEIESRKTGAIMAFGLTCCISKASSQRRATVVILLFYAIPLFSGMLFLLYLTALDIPGVSESALRYSQ